MYSEQKKNIFQPCNGNTADRPRDVLNRDSGRGGIFLCDER